MKKIVFDFFDDTSWHPNSWTIFAGALPYLKYNWLTKVVMKLISIEDARPDSVGHAKTSVRQNNSFPSSDKGP